MHHTIWGWNDKDLDDDLFVDVDPINYEACPISAMVGSNADD